MGLSFTQIVFTVVAIVIAWRVIGFLERRQKRGRLRERPPADTGRETVDLQPCARCGAYMPRGERCSQCRQEG